MKYSEAVKIAERDPDFKGAWDRFVKHCKEDNTEGAMLFRVEGNDGETFYRSVNNFYDERIDGYRFSISGGKHSASRARYLIQHDKAYVVHA